MGSGSSQKRADVRGPSVLECGQTERSAQGSGWESPRGGETGPTHSVEKPSKPTQDKPTSEN